MMISHLCDKSELSNRHARITCSSLLSPSQQRTRVKIVCTLPFENYKDIPYDRKRLRTQPKRIIRNQGVGSCDPIPSRLHSK